MRNTEQSTFAHTIAYRNPPVANKFCIEAGLGPCRNAEEIAYKLNQYIAKYGDQAVEALKEIHPDYELFKQSSNDQGLNLPAAQNQNMNFNGHGGHHNCCGMSANGYSNCSGCGGACQNRFMNASGDGGKIRPMGILDPQLTTIAGIFAITALLIYAMNMAPKKG